jgi:hypothetical protein
MGSAWRDDGDGLPLLRGEAPLAVPPYQDPTSSILVLGSTPGWVPGKHCWRMMYLVRQQ